MLSAPSWSIFRISASMALASSAARRGGDLGRRRDQVAPGRTGGGAIGKTLPRERQARGRLDHAHDQRRELATLERIIRMEGAVFVHAAHDAPFVEPENIALIGRVIVHIGDAAVRGIADGHGLGVALVVALRAERGGQHACHLRACRGLRIVAVKLVAEAFLSLEIAHIGLVPSLARLLPRGSPHRAQARAAARQRSPARPMVTSPPARKRCCSRPRSDRIRTAQRRRRDTTPRRPHP